MKQAFFKPSFFTDNRTRLAALLPKHSLVLVVSNDKMPRTADQYYTFRQNSDLYYLTGIWQPQTILAMCPDHPNPQYREVLFILHSDIVRETWDGHRLKPNEATAITNIKNVLSIDTFDQTLDELAYFAQHIYLNVSENTKGTSELLTHDLRMANTLKTRYPLHHYDRLAPLMTSLRVVKRPEEIQVMCKACEITDHAFRRVLTNIKPGMNEYEIEAELTYEMLRNGASGHAFHPIVASGRNACILHYTANNCTIGENDLVVLDFGAELSNYAADCSRTIPASGRFSSRQRQLYDAVLRIFHKVMNLMRTGLSIVQINKQTGLFWEEEHVKLGLYSMEDLRRQNPDEPLYRKYFMHGVTHSLGLDVHDVCDRYAGLEPGTILTCEPGIYIPEEGIGIRLENDILVTPADPIDLMKHIPIDAEEIESIMNQ